METKWFLSMSFTVGESVGAEGLDFSVLVADLLWGQTYHMLKQSVPSPSLQISTQIINTPSSTKRTQVSLLCDHKRSFRIWDKDATTASTRKGTLKQIWFQGLRMAASFSSNMGRYITGWGRGGRPLPGPTWLGEGTGPMLGRWVMFELSDWPAIQEGPL